MDSVAIAPDALTTAWHDAREGGVMAGERDEDAFAAEFDRLLRYAYNVGWRFFRDRAIAEEVAQETLTRAYVRWRKVMQHPTPEGWVVVTATRVAQELHRRSPRADMVAASEAAFDVDPFAHPELVAALGRLSERQRHVFVLRHAFDESVEETARHLAITASQVKDAAYEARRKLRRLLGVDIATDRTPEEETETT